MRPALVLAGALLWGCGPPPLPPPVRCNSPMIPPSTPTLVLTGDPWTLEVSFGTECDPPTAIEASVLDAENRVVPSTATLSAYVATVKFTPTTSGSHHVTARFQPNRGTVQLDIDVARDRSGEPGLDLALADATDLELGDAGVLVAGATVYRVDQGAPVALRAFSGPVRVIGDVVWARDGRDVWRFVATPQSDGGLTLEATPAAKLVMFGDFTYPTRDDIMGTYGNSVGYARTDGGAWSAHSIQLTVYGGWTHRLGGKFLAVSPMGTCLTDVTGTRDSGCSAGQIPGHYLGGDDLGLWLSRTFGLGGLDRYDGAALRGLAVPRGAAVSGTSAPRVEIGGREYLAVASPSALGYEYWGPIVSASSTTVATRVDAGVLRVRWR